MRPTSVTDVNGNPLRVATFPTQEVVTSAQVFRVPHPLAAIASGDHGAFLMSRGLYQMAGAILKAGGARNTEVGYLRPWPPTRSIPRALSGRGS